jgi:exonuclease III
MYYPRLRITGPDDPEAAWKKRCVDGLKRLRKALRKHLYGAGSSTRDDNRWIRIATWNIREFPSSKFGDRLDESYFYIAEIISHFDIVALQEIRGDLSAFRKVMKQLGGQWDYIATDVTEGSSGNEERMVFVFKKSKVYFKGVAGEITLPPSDRINYPSTERLHLPKFGDYVLPDGTALTSSKKVKTYSYRGETRLSEELHLDLPQGTMLTLPKKTSFVVPAKTPVTLNADGTVKLDGGSLAPLLKKATVDLPRGAIVGDSLQFARTPFLIEFQAGWFKFILCTVHIYYGEGKEGLRRRRDEIRALTKFLAERAASETDTDAENFFFVLGDFNIIDKQHETWEALHTNGFEVPEQLRAIPEGSNVDRSKAYDQIAYWTDPDGIREEHNSIVKVDGGHAGIFDFFKEVFRMGDDDPGDTDAEAYGPLIESMQARYIEEQREDGKNPSTTPWTYKDWRTYQMSDHLPMWMELRIDFADEYLNSL